jgi:hypothetical protein
MTKAKNYLKQWYLQNEEFSSCVALRICFLTHLVQKNCFKIDTLREQRARAARVA